MRFKRLSPILGSAGLLLAFAAVISLYVRTAWNTFAVAALSLGAVLLLVYGLFNYREIFDALTHRGALQTANAVLITLLVIAILGLVTFLAGKHTYRHDTTAARQFSLADQTLTVLQNLKEDLRLTAFFQPQEQHRFEDLLKEYAAITPRFKYQFVDPDRKPDLARRYGITAYNTTVVSYRDVDEKITTETEEDLTNAIIKVTRERRKKVCFTTHHGEKALDSEERLGMSSARDLIREKNYDVASVALLDSGRVPVDCAVLVIAGAETPFLPTEIDMVKKYLKLGGALLLLVDPERPSFHEILSEYGITAGNDLVVDFSGIGSLFGTGPNMPVVATYGNHAITNPFGQFMTAYPDARSLRLAEPLPTGIEATAIASTSPNSWAESDADQIRRGRVRFDAEVDVRGPIPLAVAATRSASSNLGSDLSGEGAKNSRLVVFGDSDFAANYLFDFQKNGDFFMSALSWLAEEEDLISIRARDPEDRRINLTASGSRVLLLVSVVLLPLAAFLAAIVIYVRRK